MRPTLVLAAVTASLCAPAAADPPSAAPAAHWLARPSTYDITQVYPRRALLQRLSGRATMQCKVTQSGAMADCHTIAETPPGAGFGQAELALAPRFKVADTSPGATLTISFNFVDPRKPHW